MLGVGGPDEGPGFFVDDRGGGCRCGYRFDEAKALMAAVVFFDGKWKPSPFQSQNRVGVAAVCGHVDGSDGRLDLLARLESGKEVQFVGVEFVAGERVDGSWRTARPTPPPWGRPASAGARIRCGRQVCGLPASGGTRPGASSRARRRGACRELSGWPSWVSWVWFPAASRRTTL